MNDTGTLQLPPQASTLAPHVDSLYYFIFWGCLVFFVLIVGLCAFFILRYRRREGEEYRHSPSHNTPLEITWTVIPLILVMIVFVWGFDGYMNFHVTPGDAVEYKVVGKQWLWEIHHPNGKVSVNEMVVPRDQSVRVLLSSDDVIHSFFVPDFRVKMDLYPNQYTTLWFKATRVGEYNLFCTEYCGDAHSGMIGKVRVLSPADYAAWEDSAAAPTEISPEGGLQVYNQNACVTCHSLDGTTMTGPSFKGIWGEEQQMADGSTIVVDENYIRESILEPNAKIVAGFTPAMPTFQGLLKDDQIAAVIELIKSLGHE